MQGMNQLQGTDFDGIYVTKPKNYDATLNYPVVIFAHGFLGNWELYQGILSELDNCIVVGIGTNNLSGLFGKKDIERIFSCHLPLLEGKGFKINHDQIHLIGLSNGGTASNMTLRHYAHQFKTVTFTSAPCEVIKRPPCKVILVGGGHDSASQGMPSASRKLNNNGTQTAIYYDEDENHFIFAYQSKSIIRFLQKELELQ